MDFINLLKDLNVKIIKNNFKDEITNINLDSRKLEAKGCFVALDGLRVDGHNFIEKAYDLGAKVFVIEKDVDVSFDDVTVLRVENSRKALAIIGKELYKRVDEKLKLIGITGTNGKTSTAFYISHVLNYLKDKTISIGTLGVKLGEDEIDLPITASTTPEFTQLLDIFDYAVKEEVKTVAMEVSSHSLALDKVYGLTFDASIFTNLTQDHLDFHKTMDEYLKAKALLFKQSKICIINVDDTYSNEILASCEGKVLTYGIDNDCDYKAENVLLKDTSIEFDLKIGGKTTHFKVNVTGRFTVYNTLGAIVTLLNTTNFTPQEISDALLTCKGVPGRVQGISSEKGFSVLIDYAHTSDALEKVISSVKETTVGSVITVFGCGGNRDKTKRPLMCKAVTTLSDFTIITSDNPRFENPEDILDDVEKGAVGSEYLRIADRKEAIKKAITLAKAGDTIIIAGKGHETYQEIGDKKEPFDDLEIAKKLLEEI